VAGTLIDQLLVLATFADHLTCLNDFSTIGLGSIKRGSKPNSPKIYVKQLPTTFWIGRIESATGERLG